MCHRNMRILLGDKEGASSTEPKSSGHASIVTLSNPTSSLNPFWGALYQGQLRRTSHVFTRVWAKR